MALQVDGDQLTSLVNSGSELEAFERGISVSLAESYLTDKTTELNVKGKTCLALVLSYSLLDFCGGPWFPQGWTKRGIHFLQYGNTLSLRPILSTPLRKPPDETPLRPTQNELKLLLHGVLLMEIFLQEPLLQEIDVQDTTSIQALRTAALQKFHNVGWDVSERYREAVYSCLDEMAMQMGGDNDSKEQFSVTFSDKVIAPLDAACRDMWEGRDPDEIVSKLQLRIIAPRKTRPPIPPKPGGLSVSQKVIFLRKRMITYGRYRVAFSELINNPPSGLI